MKNKEIEIKFKISKNEFNKLESFLAKNAIFLTEEKQIDTYFSPIGESSFILSNGFIFEWLRLREEKDRTLITYKMVFDGKNKKGREKDEYETEIKDIDQMKKILIALKFKELIVVNKHRKNYKYQSNFVISLDYVEELGYFAEVELNGKYKTIAKAEETLESVAKSLQLSLKQESIFGYPHLLMIKKGITFKPELN